MKKTFIKYARVYRILEKTKKIFLPAGRQIEAALRSLLKIDKNIKLHKSLACKFSVFALTAVVLPAMTVAFSLIIIGRYALTDSIYQVQSETAKRIADRITVHINDVRSVLSIAAAEPGIAVFTRARQEESFRHLLRWQDSLKEAYMMDASGQEVSKLSSQDNKFVSSNQLISRKNRPEFTVPMRDGKPYIGEPFFWGDRLPYLLASCPTYGRKSVLTVKVSLANLWDLVKEVAADRPGVVYVVDAKGNLIAHPDLVKVQNHVNLENLPIIQLFRGGKTGRESFGVYKNEAGEKVVSLVQEVPSLGWGVVIEIPTVAAYAPIRMMQDEVIKWTVICMIFILIFAVWRVSQIIKPIKILEEGASRIAQGQLALDLDIKTGDEIEKLSQSFQNMAKSLRELEELRRDLISMIVHDLKSPLSGIMSGIDYVLENRAGAENMEQNKKILGLSMKSAESLLQMVQNLLDVAKMEEGKLQLHYDTANITEILDECADTFRVQMEKESKALKKDYAKELPPVAMDTSLVRRVVANLISNAVRHSSSGECITLRVHSSGDSVDVVVEDSGEGIPEEYKDRIFDKFVQAERKRVHLRSGTGLGLTFCKMAIELHGGKISVESVLGQGSAFTFTLPLGTKAKTAAENLL